MPTSAEFCEDAKSDVSLPVSRIRLIMKSSVDPSVPNIKMETLHIVAKATEMLIKRLAKESVGKSKVLEYRHVADYVQSEDTLEFLHQILPKTITGKKLQQLLMESDSDTDDSDKSESSSSSSSGEEEGEEEEEEEESSGANQSSESEDDDKTVKKKLSKK